LLSLPELVLAKVAALAKADPGHPLLGVSRSTRDAVLGSAQQITLTLSHDEVESQDIDNAKPLARMLNRACQGTSRPTCLVDPATWHRVCCA
jgi:hypothetical protein